MNRLKLITVLCALAVLALGAGAVLAALGDTESASGNITVSSESADLYICEPGDVDGPDCGPDDSDGSETVFEEVENLLPGDDIFWDIRLKNVGSRDFVVTEVNWSIDETSDPGNDCPGGALELGRPEGEFSSSVIWVLGKDGDPVNDNDTADDGQQYRSDNSPFNRTPIFIAPGDYEDVRLRLEMGLFGTENCDNNEWDASWEIVVN